MRNWLRRKSAPTEQEASASGLAALARATKPVGENALLATVLLLAGVLVMAGALAGFLILVDASFATPIWLHLGWASLLAVLFEGMARRHRAVAARRFGDPAAVARLVQGRAPGTRPLKALLAAWAILYLAVASARPQWGEVEEEVTRRGADVWIAVDVSQSMLAEDVKPSRLDRAKLALDSLLERLGGDRAGLIAFAGEARLMCPLTTDRGATAMFIDLLEPDLLLQQGTAMAPALDLVRKRLDPEEGRHVAVVVLTDGEDHDGKALEIAKELAASGVAVHALGVGTIAGAPIPVMTRDGATYLKDGSGETVITKLNPASLQEIAAATGGIFSLVSSNEMELGAIASAIAGMEQRDVASTRTRTRTDRPAGFLFIAFVLLLIELVLPDGAMFRRAVATRTERLAVAVQRARQAASRKTA